MTPMDPSGAAKPVRDDSLPPADPAIPPAEDPPKRPRPVSEILDSLEELAGTGPQVRLDALAGNIGARGFGPLLLLVGVIMILPIGMIPGVGGIMGCLMIGAGVEMLRGRKGLWLPGFVARREVASSKLVSAVAWMRRPGAWIDARTRRRLPLLAVGRLALIADALILIVAGLSLFVTGAIPIVAPLYGIPLFFMALALVSADGLFALIAYGIMAGAIWVPFLIW